MSNKIESSKIAYEVMENIDGGMSRRDALKIMGLTGGAAMMMGAPTQANAGPSSDKNVKVLIVGGGAGGIMALVRLHRAMPNAEFTIIAPNETHLYQPGQVFVAAGLYTHEDLVKQNSDLIPDGVNWIKDEVATFDPDKNKVVTRGGKEVGYDYMVVATGIVYHYDKIKGLTEADIGTNGISSVYLNNLEKGTTKGGEVTWKWFNELKAAAASGKKPTAIYTQPNTPIKCGGAPQKILYLSADHLKKDGLGANFIFATNSGKLFGLPTIAQSIKEIQGNYDTITNKFKHNLVAIDVANKVATFEKTYEVKGEYDEDLEEYNMITKKEMVDIKYDFIHVVPPMSAPKAVAESKLGWQKGTAKGWLEVDQHTLQHKRYPNVFGIGDVCGIPKGKTGGSARHHGPIVAANLVSAVNGKPLEEKFDGYTVCPLKVDYGHIIMAEFNYDGLAPTIPFLDPATPRWFWWAFDLYMLKPMYWNLMMRGWM
ncbi:FAD-dependent pyridine nucleotide-disulphide oxidoreductase [hydrothermal vent metagenome]|uniref:FAD-dependent pyridine nucleotide-disulphide oxidoreductase n=1 Tax=hydrothermal vent metagenome TaxID=652676 RepID=A0A1W1BW53_9ZZZZ